MLDRLLFEYTIYLQKEINPFLLSKLLKFCNNRHVLESMIIRHLRAILNF